MTRAALLALIVVSACKHSATGVAECDDHLVRRRACAAQIGGDLGASIEREADRLEALWTSAGKRDVKGWRDKFGRKWCTAAGVDARTAFPECRW
jgi:hypothetical protein